MTVKPNPKERNHRLNNPNQRMSTPNIDKTKESLSGVEELREKISVIQHEQWSGWMEYLFSKCVNNSEGVNHGWVLPIEFVQRWKRQIATPYIELPENEKKSDQVEADKILELVSTHQQQAVAQARKEEREKIKELVEIRANRYKGSEGEIYYNDVLEDIDSLSVQDIGEDTK